MGSRFRVKKKWWKKGRCYSYYLPAPVSQFIFEKMTTRNPITIMHLYTKIFFLTKLYNRVNVNSASYKYYELEFPPRGYRRNLGFFLIVGMYVRSMEARRKM